MPVFTRTDSNMFSPEDPQAFISPKPTDKDRIQERVLMPRLWDDFCIVFSGIVVSSFPFRIIEKLSVCRPAVFQHDGYDFCHRACMAGCSAISVLISRMQIEAKSKDRRK